jgi:predicted enzyme related to lactoylglutathione lyase
MSISISEVDFVAIPSRDIEAAADFYGNTLGLKREVYMPERHFAEFSGGNVTLSIIYPEGMGLEFHPNRTGLALRVDDVHAARAELEAKGVVFHGEVLDTGVCHMAPFSDPDGNTLLLHRRYAPRVTE